MTSVEQKRKNLAVIGRLSEHVQIIAKMLLTGTLKLADGLKRLIKKLERKLGLDKSQLPSQKSIEVFLLHFEKSCHG